MTKEATKIEENHHASSSDQDGWTAIDWQIAAADLDEARMAFMDLAPDGAQEFDDTTLDSCPPGRAVLRTFVANEQARAIESRLAATAQQLVTKRQLSDPGRIETSRIANVNWWEVNRKSFGILHIGPFVVRPPWLESEVSADEIDLVVMPGEAFGTGHHATTALCLEALASIKQTARLDPATVLDMGCGSGILSLAAAKLWPARVTASDIEKAAMALTEENARYNDLAQRIHLVAPAGVEGAFDLLLANIRLPILMSLAPLIPTWIRPGGLAVLSGLLDSESGTLVNELAKGPAPLTLDTLLEQDEWHCLIMSKPAAQRNAHAAHLRERTA
ncbi:MAG: 50S ribosomal protein L11 methyltransferase [Deltaproteobacteria bacterium]|nr:50S ribosomal protein L11 methyltransferase [Deltaproteobacteria bacterium]